MSEKVCKKSLLPESKCWLSCHAGPQGFRKLWEMFPYVKPKNRLTFGGK